MTRTFALTATAVVVMAAAAGAAVLGDGTRSLYSGQPIVGVALRGRGACEVEGQVFLSETAVPRDHPCHYCVCYEGQVSCYWKECGAAPEGCVVLYMAGMCNPGLYRCTVPKMSMAEPEFGTRIRPLRKSRYRRAPLLPSTSSGLHNLTLPVQEPFPFEQVIEALLREENFLEEEALLQGEDLHSRVKRDKSSGVFWQPKDRSCTILGVKYHLGEVVGVASDPCLECRCAAGDLYCSPRCCFSPAPFSPTPDEVQQHEGIVLDQVTAAPPPHPLYNIRNQVMPGNFI